MIKEKKKKNEHKEIHHYLQNTKFDNHVYQELAWKLIKMTNISHYQQNEKKVNYFSRIIFPNKKNDFNNCAQSK